MIARRFFRNACSVAIAVALTVSCQDSVTDISLSNYDTLKLSVVGESNIQGTVGAPVPIRFQVTDETGQSVPNVSVSLSLLSESGFISPPVARSNSEGFVDAVWVLGTTAGSYELQVEGSRADGWLSDLFRRLRLYAEAEPAEPSRVEVSPRRVELDEGQTDAKLKGVNGLSGWPVSISYYKPDNQDQETPEYQVSMVLYENGVSGDMSLNYGDFILNAKLTDIKLLEVASCN